MPENIIVQRRSHVLVYGADRWFVHDELRYLDKILTVNGRDEVTHAQWLEFKAQLKDIDPQGRPVLRLPGEVDTELLKRVWPRHERAVSWKAWPARAVKIRFKSGKFPYRSADQKRITDYLAGRLDNIDYGSRLVEAATAVGKSYCAIRAWSEAGDVLLGTFAASQHLANFKTELLKFTDLNEDEIFVADDGRDSLRRAMKNPERYKAFLVLHRTIRRCLDDCVKDGEVVGRNEFSEFAQAAGVGTHISDEVHLEYKSLILLGMTTNFTRTFYLTATAGRTEWMEQRVLFQQIPISRALRIKKVPRLLVRQIRFNSSPAPIEQARIVNRQGHFQSPKYFDYVSKRANYDRWKEMVFGLISESFSDGATGVAVVVSGKLEFLDSVIEDVRERFPDKSIGNFSSRVSIKNRPSELDRDIVVTTEKSFNGSINPPRLSHMILAAPIASSLWVEQIGGRLRGQGEMPCVLLDLWDEGFGKLADLAAKRRTTYRKISIGLTQEEYGASTTHPRR